MLNTPNAYRLEASFYVEVAAYLPPEMTHADALAWVQRQLEDALDHHRNNGATVGESSTVSVYPRGASGKVTDNPDA